jgi:hypothetical protein
MHHPTDTHPALLERVLNLGLNIEEIKNKLVIPEESSISIIHKVEEIEDELSLYRTKLVTTQP